MIPEWLQVTIAVIASTIICAAIAGAGAWALDWPVPPVTGLGAVYGFVAGWWSFVM